MNEQMVKEGMRAIICCRAANGDNASLERQKEIALAYAKENGYNVSVMFTGYGAMDSLVYHSLRLRAKYREFDILLVKDIEVFGDGAVEITHEVNFLNQNGVKVFSLKDGELNVETLPQIFRKGFRLVKKNFAGAY